MRPPDDVLRRMYLDDRMSVRVIAARINAGATTVRQWLASIGVERRAISDAKRGQKPAPHTVEASVRARRKHRLRGRGVVGYKLRADGYVQIWKPDHPSATKGGYILEHRMLMEQHIGRPLLSGEDVHHKNGIRLDNRIDNLEVISHPDHLSEHYQDRRIDALGRFMPHAASSAG